MAHRTTSLLWGLVLAGGDGTRLQALTRLITGAPIPKQYCRILGTRSLLETTLHRIAPLVPAERTLAIINRSHVRVAGSQLVTLPAANVLVQPRNLDTGPGMLLSVLELARRDPDAVVAIFPSDHHIGNDAALRAHVSAMASLVAAEPGKIALLGARPDRAETGFGYIAPGDPLALESRAFRVSAFHEKPARRLATRIIRDGGLWNSFIMVGGVTRLLELLRGLRPHDVDALASVPARDGERLAAIYERIAPWNFSRDFLAAIPEHLIVRPADDLGWSDWGTPEAIERSLAALGVVPPWQLAPAVASGLRAAV
jgi:mannose-1-phosphate guanylyltransferase